MVAKTFVRFAIAFVLVASAACGTSTIGDAPDIVPSTDGGLDVAPQADSGPPDAPIVDAGADVFDAAVDPGPSSPIVFSGAIDRILLSGLVVTPDTVFDGEVLVEGSTITCVGGGGVCGALPAAAGATLVLTNGVIAPGMIDTHHHVLFDVFDDSDWMPAKAYGHHDEWPNEPKYQAMLAVKDSLASTVACEMVKWGEMKAIVAGTTSVVGNAGLDDVCLSSLARSIDTSHNGLGIDKVRTSAAFPPQAATANATCAGFTSGATAAYLVPAGEGTDGNDVERHLEGPRGRPRGGRRRHPFGWIFVRPPRAAREVSLTAACRSPGRESRRPHLGEADAIPGGGPECAPRTGRFSLPCLRPPGEGH